MTTFEKLKRDVEELEMGRHPDRFPDRATAIKALEEEICLAAWQSAEERERAQGLVHRLARLKWADEAPGCSSSDPSPAS